MKLLAKIADNKVAVVEKPIPEIRRNSVKVKVDYCALCATDIHIVTHDLYHFPKEWLPLGLGHEGAGTIVELSPEAEAAGYKIGDKVAVASKGHCGFIGTRASGCRRNGNGAQGQRFFQQGLYSSRRRRMR